MSSYIYQSSELWDIGKPLIPERSFLNHLEPIGISTPFMESLTSYIARLALSHSVVTGILISRVITSLLEQVFVKNTTSRALGALFNRSTALNGTGIIAMDFVQALEKLTLQRNLHFLTLLFWNKIISPRGLFRSHKAWCPACYQQWRLLGKEIYEPLAWTINAVKICPQHCQLLKDRCPYCQATLPLLTWRTLLGYCSNCGQWLGITEDMASSYHSKAFSTEEVHLLTWIAETVGELITVTPDLPSPPPKENIAKSLGIAIDIVALGNAAAFARILGVPKNSLWMWQVGEVLPQFDTLVSICYLLGISLLELLTSGDVSNSVEKNFHKSQKQSHKPRVSPKLFDSEQVRDVLVGVLESNQNSPPTMREVAQSLGYDRRTIFKHFPELCRAISANYFRYRKALYLENLEMSCQEVQQICAKLYKDGMYPSEARVCQLMTKPGYLMYKQVRTRLQQAQNNFPV